MGISDENSADFIKVARGEYSTERLPALSGPLQGPVPAHPLTTPQNNLPVFPTPLIGRRCELAELRQLLRDPQCHLLSLVGPGGMGKTRLAVEAASALQDRFEDGVHFVALAPVDSSRFVLPVIANAIGFAFLGAGSADPKSQLLNFLADKRMLLLVDNVEHLLQEPGIELFSEILGRAPNVKLVVTSRGALDLQGAWIFEVRGLAVPAGSRWDEAGQETSVDLFLQRARRSHVAFNATARTTPRSSASAGTASLHARGVRSFVEASLKRPTTSPGPPCRPTMIAPGCWLTSTLHFLSEEAVLWPYTNMDVRVGPFVAEFSGLLPAGAGRRILQPAIQGRLMSAVTTMGIPQEFRDRRLA